MRWSVSVTRHARSLAHPLAHPLAPLLTRQFRPSKMESATGSNVRFTRMGPLPPQTVQPTHVRSRSFFATRFICRDHADRRRCRQGGRGEHTSGWYVASMSQTPCRLGRPFCRSSGGSHRRRAPFALTRCPDARPRSPQIAVNHHSYCA